MRVKIRRYFLNLVICKIFASVYEAYGGGVEPFKVVVVGFSLRNLILNIHIFGFFDDEEVIGGRDHFLVAVLRVIIGIKLL